MGDEATLAKAYRRSRWDFIAACEAAGADAISRVHPRKGPDGKPLFCDSAAFGPRDAARALLLVLDTRNTVITQFRNLELPGDGRLVAVHALDPFAWAWGKSGVPADWPQKNLAAIVLEDLSKAKMLTALDLSGSADETMLKGVLPNARVVFRAIKPKHSEQAIRAAIAAL